MCYELWTKARDPCQRRWAPIRQPGTLARLARGLTWLNDRGFHRNSVTFKGKVGRRSGDSIALPSGQGSHSSPPRATTVREGPHPVKSYPTDHIRNVLVVGHGGAGKTSLVEALLYATGAINRVGRVEDGTTVTDFEPEENRKHISASLAVAPVEHDGYKVNLLDAPGYADFIGDVRTALPAADAVLFVVSAVDGVETQTEVVWTMAEELGLPRAFFINKLDRERASFQQTLEAIQRTFGKGCPPLYLPIGQEHDFHGLVGLLSNRAFEYKPDGSHNEGDVPDELASSADDLRSQLIEAIIQESEDEELMDRYLGGETIAPADLIPDLETAVSAGRLFPVLAGAATKGIGIPELLEVLTQAFPSPAQRQPYEGKVPGSDRTVTRTADPDGPLAAYVFKTVSDPYVGRMNLFRVVSGTLLPDSTVLNATKGRDERVGHLLVVRGKSQEPAERLVAGDIGAVAKLSDTTTGDTLCSRDDPVVLPAPSMPDPLLPIAIAPKSRGDEEKLSGGLARLDAEDLTLRLERKFGVEVNQVPLRLPYKETFKSTVKGLGRHVKQTGGHGQYAIANIEVQPLPGGGHQGAALRRQVPLGRLLRHGLPARRAAGAQGGGVAGADRPAGADPRAGGADPRRVRGRRARRPVVAAWPRGRHRPGRHRPDAGACHRARGRGDPLRDRPALDDPRQGLVRAPLLALRGAAVQPGRQGRRGGQGRRPEVVDRTHNQAGPS